MEGCVVVRWSNPTPHLSMFESFCWPSRYAVRGHSLGFCPSFSAALFSLGGNWQWRTLFQRVSQALQMDLVMPWEGGEVSVLGWHRFWLLVEWKHWQSLPPLRSLHLSNAVGVSPAPRCGCHWSCQLTVNICWALASPGCPLVPSEGLENKEMKKEQKRKKKVSLKYRLVLIYRLLYKM